VNAAMVYLVNSPDTSVDLIDLKYLESGHTYMECDSIHAKIEKTKKYKCIFTTSEMRMIIESARMNPCPYNVNVLDFSEFYDTKKLATEIVVNHNLYWGVHSMESVHFLHVKWFRFQRNSSEIPFKYEYNDEF